MAIDLGNTLKDGQETNDLTTLIIRQVVRPSLCQGTPSVGWMDNAAKMCMLEFQFNVQSMF